MDLGRTFDVLCDTCEAILDQTALDVLQYRIDVSKIHSSPSRLRPPGDNIPTKKPHLTLKSLVASANDGCHLCSLIFKSMTIVCDEIENDEIFDDVAFRSYDLQLFTSVEPRGLWISGELRQKPFSLRGHLQISRAVG
jgi:hypothetical protein